MRGLLLDFGGVLTTNVFDSFKAFCVAEGLDPQTVKRTFREDPEALALLRRLEKGEIELGPFSQQFAERLGLPAERAEGLVERLFSGIGPDEDMRAAVERFRAQGVKTGVVSNSWGGTTYDDSLQTLFDTVVISGEVGLHKPEPEIYRLAAEQLGVPPEECVFVDDLRENCAGAEAVGMTAVLHRGADSTVPRLEELLGL